MRKLNRNKTEVIFAGSYNSGEKLSGPEKTAKRLFYAYTKNHKSVFIDYFLDGKKYGILKKLFGHELVSEVNGSPVLRLGLLQVIFAILKTRPKIVHLITYERFYSIIFLLKPLLQYKIIYNVHGIRVHENEVNGLQTSNSLKRKDNSCEKLYFRRSDKLLFLSQSSIALAEEYYKINPDKIRLVRNGIDEIFHKVSENKSFQVSILKIVFVGEVMNKLKGFDFLYNTLQKLNSPVELYVVSDSKIGLTGTDKIKIFFTKKMDTIDFANFLKDKTIYISPSESDSFSITAVECMSAGLVPVLTFQTGSSELIKNGINGFVINFNDETSLLNVLTDLNNNAKTQTEVSFEARKIYELLSWNKVSQNYVEIYQSII